MIIPPSSAGRVVRAAGVVIGLAVLTIGVVLADRVASQPPTSASRASVWVATLTGLLKAAVTDGSVVLHVPSGPTLLVGVDESRGRVWAYCDKTLFAVDSTGQTLLSVAIPKTPPTVLLARALAVDPATGAVWLALGQRLHHVGSDGTLLASVTLPDLVRGLAFDAKEGRLWVASRSSVASYDGAGQRGAALNLGSRPEVSAVAVDAATGDVWVALERKLRRHRANGALVFEVGLGDLMHLADDGAGGVWTATVSRLRHLDPTGHTLVEHRPFADGIVISSLAADPGDQSVWVSGLLTLRHVGAKGERLAGPTMPGVVFDLALQSGNRNPIAQDDTAATKQNVSVDVGVLANDSDPDGDSLTIVAVDQGAHGAVAIGSTATSVTYTPNANALGPDTFTYTISDGHGGTATATVTMSVVLANHPPIAVDDTATTPENTPVTLTVLGNDSDPDGDAFDVAATAQGAHGAVTFSATTVTYTPQAGFNGTDSFTYTVRDPAGATAVATVRVTVTPVNDAPVVSLAASPAAGTAPLQVVLAATASDPDGDALTYAWDFGDGQTKPSGTASETHTYQVAGSFTARVTVSDGGASASATVAVRADSSGLPPDPGTVAPPVAPGVATTVARGTEFLYTGSSPIQSGVAPGTIEARRAAVLRGRVVTRDGAPLPGARITILNHPEFGETLSRADGMFDMAVNGGAPLTIDYRKAGLLPAQRQVDVPWQDYAIAPEVVLIPLDTQASTVDLTAGTMQVARGSAMTDADGTRRATLLFPSGTQAALVLPNGSTQALGSLTVRATEYTVGPEGPRAMPAALPPTSGYTYAVELSADEAIGAGARGVTFSQPVIYHLENFLNFPVGEIVPVGFYDRERGQWMASPNGRVIQIVSLAGGLAQLDTTGSGAVDNGAALGVSDAERQQLASLYPVGQSLWRAPIPHFSSFDLNWPFGPPAGAESPNQPNPKNTKPSDDPCEASGSIIECHNQILGERVGLVGVPFSLNYRSGRAPGYTPTRSLEIPVTSATIPPPLKRVDLTVSVAGVRFPQSFAALPNQTARFTWDGRDAYGRQLQGAQVARVVIGYVYDALYGQTANLVAAWAQTTGGGRQFQFRTTSSEFILTQTFTVTIENWDARPLGLGGWTLDVHHAYDPIAQVLYRGDGSRRSAAALDRVINTVAGNGECCFSASQDGGPATQAAISPDGIAVGQDGSLYIAGSNGRLRRVTPNGTIVTIAGNGNDLSDGIPAGQARLVRPRDVAVGPDGSLYVSDQHRIRRITPDGVITTVAGTGTAGFSGDGGPATQAQIDSPIGLVVGPDSAVYVADTNNNRIRRIGPEGLISTVAGNGAFGCSGDGGLATGARLSNPEEVAIGPDGSLYIVDCDVIRRVGPDGVITRFAGGGGLNVDGVLATLVSLNAPRGVAVGPDGTVYIGESIGRRVRRVASHGIITTVAGNGARGFSGDGGPATQAALNLDQFSFDADVAVGPDGALYIADFSNRRVRRVGPALPGFAGAQFTVASGDAREVYAFDADGRHLRTLDALTGAVLFEFTYDAGSRLASVVEKTGGIDNVTTIEHDGAGNPTTIIAPFGQRTALAVDTNGFLTRISNPANESVQASYSADGLLAVFTDPRGNPSRYFYDGDGRLVRAENPVGGFTTLSRSETVTGFTVAKSTALGRTTTYTVEQLPTGETKLTNTLPGGEKTDLVAKPDGTRTLRMTDGTVIGAVLGPDPRFGMQTPVVRSLTETVPSSLSFQASTESSATLPDPANPLNVTSLTDTTTIDANTSTITYDAASRTYTGRSPTGRTRTLTIDSLGRASEFLISGLEHSLRSYDERGRLGVFSIGSGANNRRLTFAYNPEGLVENITDHLGRTGRFTYDAAGRSRSQTLADGRVIGLDSDTAGNLVSVVPPSRPAYTFTYSGRSDLTSVTPPTVPGAGPTTYEYNLDGQMTRINEPGGRTVLLGYDGGGRPSTRSLMTDGTVTSVTSASYEPVTGHIKTITGPGAQSLTYTFDGHHIVGVAWAGPVSGAVTRTYDSGFRLATESVNDTSQVTYAYDADDLLVGVGDLTIQRDAASGLPTGASLGVLSETIGHNGFAELIEQTVTANGAPLYNVSYALDPLGRVSQKTETVDGVTTVFVYGYDAVGRLTSLTRDGASLESYSYDSNGNRATATVAGTSVTPTHDDQDRLLRYGNVQYTYNGSGQLATRTDGVQTTTYDYDAIGNLLGVSLPNGTAIAYLLDGLDRRVGKKINGAVVQRLLYAGDRPIAELDDQGAILSRFVYAGSDLAPIVIVKNGVAHRVITDQIGSVRLVVNTTTGTIVQRMDYDGFGNVLGDTNPGFQPFGFAGGLYDRDTGLVRFGARDYDPAIGRWTARDPIWFEGGDSNLYVYAHNDPINGNDPTGASVPVDVAAAIVNSFVLTPYLQFQLWVYTGGLGPLILDGLLPFLGIDPVQTLSDFFGLGVDTQSTAYVATDICIGVAEVAAGGAGAAKAARAAAEAQKAAELAKALEARRLAQAAEQAGKQVFKGEIAARTQAAKLAEKASADNRKAADELLRRTEREGWRTHPGGGRGGGRY